MTQPFPSTSPEDVQRDLMRRARAAAEGAVRAGAQLAEEAPELASLRATGQLLLAQTDALVSAHRQAMTDPDLSDEGRARKVEDLRRRIRERVTGIMARSYDADERRYLERFAPPSPPRTLATDDANRITVALAQARLLRADEFVNQLLEAAATTDYPLLRGLLPVARSFADREAVRHAGIGPAIQLAEAVLAGAHGHAHQRAHEVAPQVRRQVETVARTLMAEGRWHGTTFARMEPSPVPDLGLTAVEA